MKYKHSTAWRIFNSRRRKSNEIAPFLASSPVRVNYLNTKNNLSAFIWEIIRGKFRRIKIFCASCHSACPCSLFRWRISCCAQRQSVIARSRAKSPALKKSRLRRIKRGDLQAGSNYMWYMSHPPRRIFQFP